MNVTPTLPRQAIVDMRAAALTSARYDLMAEEYSYPLTIYLGGQAQVATSRAEVIRFYAAFHKAMQVEGFHVLTGRVMAEDLPRRGRFRLWTYWFASGPSRTREQIAATVCYCSTLSGGIATEMVEFSRLSLRLGSA